MFEANVNFEVQSIRARINDQAVCERASALKGGVKCEIEHPPARGRGSLMGCANYHARIRLTDDNSAWLIRVPRMNSSIPQSLVNCLIRSEYAAIKFLETTKVPAPRAFDYGILGDSNNRVGVSYLLIEEMPGKTWLAQGPRGKRFADDKDKERIWNSLADVLIELRQHPFSQAGSLLPGPSPSQPIVSAIASDRFLVLSPCGPFNTSNDYYTSLVEQNMALITDGQLFTFFPANAYIVFLYLKSRVQILAAKSIAHSVEVPEQFYLKHVDDKGDHLMVDEELNVVGIIDWQMARVVPAGEAFGPSLVTADMGAMYNDRSSLTFHDLALTHSLKAKGAAGLANIMGGDESSRRFFWS
ncbi:Phosphotransferase enzyme family [Penicillium ucsense]|uniref:Phosphotransferase enzyme family n=1 Tax=Penicillium ucsense TaxID=2839758 RepID=A0A8J8WHF6_9EURO|nr:Phosphotransferase enzyme family [Penicillium ucsense]KAF7733915.1 Phosphotransferase enzyme family [Penicillium ucsense]